MQEIASLFAKISADSSGLERGLKSARSDLDSFANKANGIGNVVSGAFKVMGVAAIGAGVAIAGAIAKSVSSAGDLEQQAANISAVFGNMAPPVEEVKGLINSLALDPKLVVGVGEAGANLEMLAKNGLSWSEIADGAARSTVLLANATGADMATASDIATNALGIFGLEVKDLDGVVATFVNAANSSQFGVEDLGMAMANAGPKAAAMGIDLQELFAAVTLTSSGFSSGQTAGTSFAYLINGLTPSTQKATDAMKELGLITADGANQFFNADGSGKNFNEIIGILQRSMGGLTAEQKMTYSETLFGQEAFGALSGVLGINIDEFNKLIPTMTDFSAVEKGAATRTNTYQAAMAALSDTINSVFAMIGDKFLPTFTQMSRAFATFIKDNAKPIVDFFGRFADSMTSAFASVGAAIGTFRSFFSLQLATITSDNASWGERMVAIWDIVASLGNTLWQSLEAALPKWIEQLGEWARAAWQWLVDSIPFALQKLGEWAAALWGWIVTNAPTWAANFVEWAKATWQWIVDVTPVVVQKIGELGLALVQGITTWAFSMGPVVSDLWNIIVNLFTAGYALVTGDWDLFWNSLKNIVINFQRTIWPALQALGARLWQWIAEAIPATIAKLAEWGSAIWDWLRANAPQWVQTMMDWAEAGAGFIAAVGRVVMVIGSLFKPIIEAIAQFVSWQGAVIAFAVALALFFAPAIGGAMMAAMIAIAAFVASAGAILLVTAAIIAAVVAMRLAWENDFLGIRTAILYAWDVISRVFGEVGAKIEWFVALFRLQWALMDVANATVSDRLMAVWYLIRNVAAAVWAGIVEVVSTLLPPFLAKMQEWGDAAWEWLGKAIPLALRAIGEWGAAIFKWIGDNLPNFLKMVFEWGTALYTWIGDVIPKAIDALTDFIKGLRGKGDSEGGSQFGSMVGEWAIKLWKWITDDLIPKVGPAFMDFIKAMANYGIKLTLAIGELAKELGLLLWKWIVDATSPALRKLGEWGQALWQWLSTNLPKWIENLSGWGFAIWDWIVKAIPAALQKLGEWGGALIGWLGANLPNFLKTVLVWATALVTWITDAIPGAINRIADFVQGLRDEGSGNGLQSLLTMAGDWAGALWRWIVDDLIPAVGPAWLKFMAAMAILFYKMLEAVGNLALQLGITLWQWIVDVTPMALTKLGLWGSALWGWFTANLPSWLAKLGTWAQAAWQWIVDMTPKAVQKLGEWGRELMNWLGTSIGGWVGKFLQAGRDILQGLWDGLKEKWTGLTTWLSEKWEAIKKTFVNAFRLGSPSKVFHDYGENLMQGLQGGINDAAQLPLNAIDSLASQVQTKVSGMTTAVANSAQTIRDTINNMPALPAGYWSSPVVPQPPAPAVPVPVVPPPPVPVEPPTVGHGAVEFGSKNLGMGLNMVTAFVDASDTLTEISQFAATALRFLTDPSGPGLQGSSAAYQAAQSLTSGGVDSLSVNNVLAMLQALISKLDERGLGSQFEINMAPDSSLGQQQELEALVAYLNALYA